MINNAWLEVRCCYTPQKLLGWLPCPRGSLAPGREAFFPVMGTVGGETYIDGNDLTKIALSVATFAEADAIGRFHGRLAFKAEGVSVETLRRIGAFVENSA